MTIPVTQSTRIEMTTSVTQTRVNDQIVMQFFLPAFFNLKTAPEPTDPARWRPAILP